VLFVVGGCVYILYGGFFGDCGLYNGYVVLIIIVGIYWISFCDLVSMVGIWVFVGISC